MYKNNAFVTFMKANVVCFRFNKLSISYMNGFTFSIIMPVYNAESHLAASIETVISQSYTNYELILINDGSSDSSLSICEKYSLKNDNIIIVNQINQGVSVARNSGLNIAQGEYILFIDSDDFFYNNQSLKDLYKEITSNMADCYQFKTFRKTNDNLVCIKDIKRDEILPLNVYGKRKLSRGEIWNYVFKRSIIEQYKLRFEPGLRISEDQAFVYSYLANCTNVKVITTPVYIYNMDNESSCTHHYNYNKDLYDHILATSIIIKHNQSNNSFINERIAMMILHTVYITTKLDASEIKKYNVFFRRNICFNLRYLANNKFVFVLAAFFNLKLGRFLYKVLIGNR